MTGLYLIVGVLAGEFILLAFVKPIWLRAGLLASILLGFLALFFLVMSIVKTGTENLVLESFGILNMLLPILFSIEIHLVTQQKPEGNIFPLKAFKQKQKVLSQIKNR